MRLKSISLFPYTFPLLTGEIRNGFFLCLTDDQGHNGWGEIAPLPQRSEETTATALEQLQQKRECLYAIQWDSHHGSQQLEALDLYPSVSFAMESALLSLLSPLQAHSIPVSAFFMGTVQEILDQAEKCKKEGYHSAKLKVSSLSTEEALMVINALKGQFRLRIDVNRAWKAAEAIPFFSQFSKDAFDYVEEPMAEIDLLSHFPLPLAIDESFPHPLSCTALEALPILKAIVFKPSLQGGLEKCLPLYRWAKSRDIEFVFSSSFESDLGLRCIATMAYRLSKQEGIVLPPAGIGTVDCLPYLFCSAPFPYLSPPNTALLSTLPILL